MDWFSWDTYGGSAPASVARALAHGSGGLQQPSPRCAPIAADGAHREVAAWRADACPGVRWLVGTVMPGRAAAPGRRLTSRSWGAPALVRHMVAGG